MAMQFTRNYDLLNMYASGAYYWNATKSVANNWRLRGLGGDYQSGYPFTNKNYSPFGSLLRRNGSDLPTIRVGTSGTAFSYDDYNITTFNVTEYNNDFEYVIAQDNSSITITMYISFLNSSGSDQTVREIGLICTPAENKSYLIAREVLATPIVVPNNAYFKVPITFTVNVPQNLIPSAE